MSAPPGGVSGLRSEIIQRQARLACDAMAQAVPAGARVALLDWPEYANVGDSAIWLGSLVALRAAGARLAYVASLSSYERGALERALGADGIVLLQGGGNLGDLWPQHEQHRRRVLEDCVDRTVVQLPQSTHFDDLATAEETGRRLRAHPRFLLMVRDRASEAFAVKYFGCRTELVPDMAFALGPLRRRGSPRAPVTWMSRGDKERPERAAPAAGALRPWDWVSKPAPRLLERLKSLGEAPPRPSRPEWLTRRVRPWAYERIARRRLEWGLALLSTGAVVVTNRLHGHILALLAGIPQFVSDSRQGKVRAYYDAWTHDAPGVTWCESEEEALRRARASGEDRGREG